MHTPWSTEAGWPGAATALPGQAGPQALPLVGGQVYRVVGVLVALAMPLLALGAVLLLHVADLILSFGLGEPSHWLGAVSVVVLGLGVVMGVVTFRATRTRPALEVDGHLLRLRLPETHVWELWRGEVLTVEVGAGQRPLPRFLRVLPLAGAVNLTIFLQTPRRRPAQNGWSPLAQGVAVGVREVRGCQLTVRDPAAARAVLLAHRWPVGPPVVG